MLKIDDIVVSQSASLRDTMACIDRGAKGIALVVSDELQLLATLTDGDMRRAMLAGRSLESSVCDLLHDLRAAGRVHPITAAVSTPRAELVRLMADSKVRHIPLVDTVGKLCGLSVLDEFVEAPDSGLQALIMAGGYGKRLMPLTADVPKPMLDIGGRPLIEHVVDQLRNAGIKQVNISTHYKAEKIAKHFGDGAAFGVKMEYVLEDQPLGTAGALSLLSSDEPILVVNGDILTKLDFRALRDFHEEHSADMTVAVREFAFDVPYGVIETDGAKVVGVTEKPTMKFFVNAGVYLLSARIREFVPKCERFDMTQLIERLISSGRTVVSFPIWEYWLDIGRQEDFEKAQRDVKNIAANACL